MCLALFAKSPISYSISGKWPISASSERVAHTYFVSATPSSQLVKRLQQRAYNLRVMVHLRLNERETNPNPYINFITALPTSGDERERARQLLRALAAQVKPVMKGHGLTVNSFEEVRVTEFHDLPEHRQV